MNAAANMPVNCSDTVVVGSGIAGLICALALAPRPVTLITKTQSLAGGSSFAAKGGIAAALGSNDSPEEHAQDTLQAGAGLSDPERALGLAAEGVESLRLLIDAGVPFDRAFDGSLHLAREAAHRHARVAHAGGDSTGEAIVSCLVERVRNTPSIRVLENTFACDLVVSDGCIEGLISVGPEDGCVFQQASRVVLATGGIGMAWWHTTNPAEATGDGLAMAARAGARLSDLEFMQFHPTALMTNDNGDGASLPLLTEALRGAGAELLDETGCRFMLAEHPSAELAPRDVVARAIHRRISANQTVLLDLRPVFANSKAHLFPQALEFAKAAGFDPETDPLPITPAAHYHMGGVQTDERGRTSVSGLWACGEVATTGIHGANRLASNSLLEALVYARRVAEDVRSDRFSARSDVPASQSVPGFATILDESRLQDRLKTVRTAMSAGVGIIRSESSMTSALSTLTDQDHKLRAMGRGDYPAFPLNFEILVRSYELNNIVLVARLVTLAALQREESRGAHFRNDCPGTLKKWQRRQKLTINSLDR